MENLSVLDKAIQRMWAFWVALVVKNPRQCRRYETGVRSLGREDSPGEGSGYPFQYSCLENPHGQRSLAGYSPWGRKESDTTERLNTHAYAEDVADPIRSFLLPMPGPGL